MTQAIADVLDAAADLLTPEGAWTQGNLALDANGAAVYHAKHPRAVCWCASGAVLKASPKGHDALLVFSRFLGRHVPTWNDEPGRTQAEVIAKLREAATAARQSNDMEGEGRGNG